MPKYLVIICWLMVANTFVFGQIKLKQQAPLTDVKMKNTQGEDLSLDGAKKKNGLIVIFSCNTCPFVVGTPDFPGWERQYNAIFEAAAKQEIGVVIVNSNEGKRTGADSFEEMVKHAKDQNYLAPYLLDEKSQLANAFGAKTTPHIFFLDGNLKLIYMGSIDNIWDNKREKDEPYLLNAIQAQSEAHKIKPASTPPKGCSIKRVTNN